MSGGHFEYRQYQIDGIADDIERLIASGDYAPSEVAEFKNGVLALKIAAVYAQRIDWFVSGDDGEESFHRRLRDDLLGPSKKEAGDGS